MDYRIEILKHKNLNPVLQQGIQTFEKIFSLKNNEPFLRIEGSVIDIFFDDLFNPEKDNSSEEFKKRIFNSMRSDGYVVIENKFNYYFSRTSGKYSSQVRRFTAAAAAPENNSFDNS